MQIGDKDKGGLKMMEFDSMNKALKASWVKRFKNDILSSPWKIIPDYMAHHLGGFKFLLSCTDNSKELTLDNIPLFYLEVLKHWELINKVMSNCDKDNVDISEIIIWNNTGCENRWKTDLLSLSVALKK